MLIIDKEALLKCPKMMLFWFWYYLTHNTISLIDACNDLVPSLCLTLFLAWCWVLILPTWTQLIHWVNRHEWAQRQRCLSDHEGSETWRRTGESHKRVFCAEHARLVIFPQNPLFPSKTAEMCNHVFVGITHQTWTASSQNNTSGLWNFPFGVGLLQECSSHFGNFINMYFKEGTISFTLWSWQPS